MTNTGVESMFDKSLADFKKLLKLHYIVVFVLLVALTAVVIYSSTSSKPTAPKSEQSAKETPPEITQATGSASDESWRESVESYLREKEASGTQKEQNKLVEAKVGEPTKIGLITWLNNYVSKEYPRFNITLFDGDNLATDQSSSFEAVILVNPAYGWDSMSCDYAKITAYDIYEGIYSNLNLKDRLQRVKIIVPYNLRSSLGSSDGFMITENTAWRGDSSFWKTFSNYPFNVEDESGALENRTWTVLLDRCK